MSENKAKTPAEQAAAAQVETPEPVEEQAVQAESGAADTAEQPAAPAEPEEAPQEVSPRPVIVVAAPQGLNLRKGPPYQLWRHNGTPGWRGCGDPGSAAGCGGARLGTGENECRYRLGEYHIPDGSGGLM